VHRSEIRDVDVVDDLALWSVGGECPGAAVAEVAPLAVFDDGAVGLADRDGGVAPVLRRGADLGSVGLPYLDLVGGAVEARVGRGEPALAFWTTVPSVVWVQKDSVGVKRKRQNGASA
jgi:hypothetical protein